jgi:hypothetical protein
MVRLIMDERARAIFDVSREALEHPGLLGERKSKQLDEAPRVEIAEPRVRHNPEPVSQPSRTFTDAEIVRLIADAQAEIEQKTSNALAEYERGRQAFIKSGLAERDERWRDVLVEVLKQLADDHAALRKQLRAEIAKARPAEEFFYLDDDGKKQDADLHNAILGPVDHPVDEKIMAPIRARNRAKWLAEQEAKRRAARRPKDRGGIIDLPAFISRRHA